MRSRWVPLTLLTLAAIGLIAAIVSISVGEKTVSEAEIGEVGEVQELIGGIRQLEDRLGDDDAPVSMTLFTDVQCPRCADYQREVVDSLITDFVRTGAAKIILRHRPLGLKPVNLGGIGTEAAAEQGKGWQYAEIFIRNLDQVPQQGVDEELLREVAAATPKLDTDEWEQAVGTDAVREAAEADDLLATELRISADPALIVEGASGSETLEGAPSLEEVRAAIDRVG